MLSLRALIVGTRLKTSWTRLLLFLAVMGPGLITGNVDNDANGIATYSVAGASFGYRILWTLFLTTFALSVVQEMAARMGAVTGKGLADLIRERFGVRLTLFAMVTLVAANLANTVGDFAGVAGSLAIFGVSRYVSVPAATLLVWLLVVKGSYRSVERVFLGAILVYVTYIASAILARPPWGQVLRETITPSFEASPAYLATVIGVVGTTIAPWMQFYHQASVVDKGITAAEYRLARWDTYVGMISANLISFFIVVACGATLFVHGIRITDARDAALALAPLAGRYASVLFAVGLLNAALFSVAIIPLSTAYAVCQAFGWESGLDRTFKEAPMFLGLYTGMLIVGALVVLVPRLPLIPVMLASQVFNGVLLPVIVVFMLILCNDRRLMGEHTNHRSFNLIAGLTVGVLVVLTLLLVLLTLFPRLVGG